MRLLPLSLFFSIFFGVYVYKQMRKRKLYSHRILISSHQKASAKSGSEHILISSGCHDEKWNKITAAKVNSIHIPNTLNNVPRHKVFSFEYSINNVDYTITPSPGFYTVDELMAYIVTESKSLSEISLQLDTTTQYGAKVTMTSVAATVGQQIRLPKPNLSTGFARINYMLGYDEHSELSTTSSLSLTAPYPPKMTEDVHSVVIKSKTFGKHSHDNNFKGATTSSHLATVPVDVPWGQTQHYIPTDASPIYHEWTVPKPITSRWDFTLVNWRGELVDLGNSHWNMIVTLYY